MRSFHRGFVAFLAAVVVAAGLVIVNTAPAAAGTVQTYYRCSFFGKFTWFEWFDVTVSAPATARRGQTVTVTADIRGTQPVGDEVPAGTYSAALDIVLGGASSGTIKATNFTQPTWPANSPKVFNDGSVQLTLANAGDVTLKPTNFRYSGIVCGGSSTVAHTIRVTA